MKLHLTLLTGVVVLLLLVQAVPAKAGGEYAECAKRCGCDWMVADGHRPASNCSNCHVRQCTSMAGYCEEWAGPYNDDCSEHIPCSTAQCGE